MRAEQKQATDFTAAELRSAAARLDETGSGAVGASAPIRDLAALLALPRLWRDREPSFIARGLLDVLVSLLRLDTAYVCVRCERDDSILELSRPVEMTAAGLGQAFARVEDASTVGGEQLPYGVGNGVLHLLRIPAQFDDQHALIVAASRRADFPTDVESFLGRVAVEQAMLAIHATRLVSSLTAANAAKATFLATMSHELRTPLNAVIGYSELLTGEVTGMLNAQQQQHVRRIDAAARHLLGLIESILTFARLEAGKEQVMITDIDPAEVTESVVNLIEPMANAKPLTIQLRIPPDLPSIPTDEAKLRQILLNLLSNAIKFTHHGGITLGVAADSNAMCWTVADSGIGISPADLDRIFEPFGQVNDRHADRTPGTGLGLSVSRQLARLLGGDVAVTSALDQGSEFTLRLPLKGMKSAAAAAAQS
jgi:signal transduction histidine kinase